MSSANQIMRSLIIEDDEQIRRRIARALKSERFAFHAISDVTADLDLEPFLDCRLIIIDLMMIQGFYLEFLTRIRTTLPNAKLLLLSVGDGLHRDLEVFGVTRQTCVTDPYDRGELAKKIATAIHQLGIEPVVATNPSAPQQMSSQTSPRTPAARQATPTNSVQSIPARGERGVESPVPKITVKGTSPLAIEPLGASPLRAPGEEYPRCHVIVVGSEKGGTGKSTIAMHLIASLLHENHRVSSLDLDSRQGSLTQYLENRRAYDSNGGQPLPLPKHSAIPLGTGEMVRFETALEAYLDCSDYLIIDTPGSDTDLSRMAHAMAGTLITPINDSFIDLDALARFETGKLTEVQPSHYSLMIRDANEQKILRDGRAFDWIVLRNRLSNLESRNKKRMADTLDQLADQLGFRQGPGLAERVIYRELFLSGLTLVDLRDETTKVKLTRSHVAARQELRTLRAMIELHRPLSASTLDGHRAGLPKAS